MAAGAKKGRGGKRSAKVREVPRPVEALGTHCAVEPVQWEDVDLGDRRFRFGVVLRVADLVEGIQRHG